MKPITDLSQLDFKKQYTYSDYLTWQFSERVELIKGWIYKMSPAPRRIHQEVSVNLIGLLWSHFRLQDCKVYEAPFDVRLKKTNQKNETYTDTVVQPDVCVICDNTKLDEAGCMGAPDLIIEILSDSTAKKDYNEKFNLYEENEVKEYWIVNPISQTIEAFSLVEGNFHSIGLFNQKDGAKTVDSKLFPELKIELSVIFS
jgi:Uma2 family endonuclease